MKFRGFILFVMLFSTALSLKAQDTAIGLYNRYWFQDYGNYDFYYDVVVFGSFGSPQIYDVMYNDSFYYLYRYDNTVSRKASFNSNDSLLLFDFTLNIGDTFRLESPDSTYTYEVVEVDSIEIFGHQYTRQYLEGINHDNDEVFVEGIGSLYGGLIEYWYRYNKGEGELLRGICIEEKDIALQCDRDTVLVTKCSEVDLLSINEKSIVLPELVRNPVEDILKLKNIKGLELVITNCIGQQMYNTSSNSSANHLLDIDVRDYPSGLYYIRVTRESGEQGILKFIKI